MKKLQEQIKNLRSKRDANEDKKATKKLLLEKKQSVYESLSKFGGTQGSGTKPTSLVQKQFLVQKEQTDEECTKKAESLLKVRFMI